MGMQINDATMAQSKLMEQQMNALSREAESARRALNAGAPVDEEKKLRKACEGFEAVFIQKVWESMRASVPEEGLVSGSKEEKFWQGMYDQELGKSIASSGGIGLADMMVSQLTRTLHKASDVAAAATSRKPLNIEPVPLMVDADAIKLAGKSTSLENMYDTPASLEGVHAGEGAASNKSSTPPVVQAALDDLAILERESRLIVTTQTFIAGSSAATRRPISTQTRIIQTPNNVPANTSLGSSRTQTNANTVGASRGVGFPQATDAESVPLAPYAANTILTRDASDTVSGRNNPAISPVPAALAASGAEMASVSSEKLTVAALSAQAMQLQNPMLATMPNQADRQEMPMTSLVMPPTPFTSGQSITPVTMPVTPMTSASHPLGATQSGVPTASVQNKMSKARL